MATNAKIESHPNDPLTPEQIEELKQQCKPEDMRAIINAAFELFPEKSIKAFLPDEDQRSMLEHTLAGRVIMHDESKTVSKDDNAVAQQAPPVEDEKH